MKPEIVPARSGHIEVDGKKVWWEYHGSGEKEVVCLLNGLAMATGSWYGFLPQLSDEYDIILYDYFGQGQSSKDDIPYLIPDFAHHLELIINENGIDKIHLMGISYGGFIALEFARLYQERLHTVLLSGILLGRERLFDMYQEISLRFYRSSPEVFEIYTYYMYEKIFGEGFVSTIPPETLSEMRQRFYDRYIDHRHCLIRLTEAQNPFFAALDESDEAYRTIKTPTLVVAGAQDRAIPLWQQEKICSILPNSKWMVVPEAGHVVYLEKPDAFFETLRKFMAAKCLEF